jgi:hypothetical protein
VYYNYAKMTTTVSRINITLPKNLVEELKKVIPPRERSKVIAEALRRRIATMKREESLKKLKGVWDKTGGVAFKSDKELASWRKSLWTSTEKRFSGKIRG